MEEQQNAPQAEQDSAPAPAQPPQQQEPRSTSTLISEVNLFIEGLRREMPEIFTPEGAKPPEQAAPGIESQPADDTAAPVDENRMLFRGIYHTLKVCRTAEVFSEVTVKNGEIRVGLAEDDNTPAQQVLDEWLQETAEKTFTEKVAFWCSRMEVQCAKVTVKDQKTLWGSCSQKGNINFSWRLLKAPEAVLDYLVVHELAHLKRMSHDDEYWEFVSQWCPDYKQHRRWLRNHAKELFRNHTLTPATQEAAEQ
ncbi:MAG: M48 family metallopeptidase [Elusimicrobia bacterium]|nr:M48 family metallopeptidase [Elusimicrobiota bacterium]